MDIFDQIVTVFEQIVSTLERYVWNFPEVAPLVVIFLLGTGLFLTFRLKFIQLRRLGHGFGVTSGKYDDPNEPGDVSHFQALSTALSATVGIGNIAGVAIALHWGGPGALFWMWVTAVLGMAVKFSEVTLALHYREVHAPDEGRPWEGTVSGGPMYYIERGLGPKWKPLAVFFAVALGFTAFLTGNSVQANTVADVMSDSFGLTPWITGLITASVVGLVIIGGIRRIGAVTGILAPTMAVIYVTGALIIIGLNYDDIIPTLGLIVSEAFNPTAGVAGTGAGTFILTLMWGVRRGLYSNEAGQGSAPIAHAAAKTDEPVSEGVVALLEPFIDTLVICTMTGLVILMTGAWGDRVETTIDLTSGNVSYLAETPEGRYVGTPTPESIIVDGGEPEVVPGGPMLAWYGVPVDRFYVDAAQTEPFEGTLRPSDRNAVHVDGTVYATLYGMAPTTGAPLTSMAFRRGLQPLGDWGHYIVILSVLLFAVSTSIAWSYYGDRCAFYLFGRSAVLPYKFVFVLMHFVGAIVALTTIWTLGDVALGVVIIPNLLALILLSGVVVQLTRSYFERKPWLENYEVHRRIAEERKRGQTRP